MPVADSSLIDDIEDIVNKNSSPGEIRQENKRLVVPKSRRIKQTREEPVQADSIIPGTKLSNLEIFFSTSTLLKIYQTLWGKKLHYEIFEVM